MKRIFPLFFIALVLVSCQSTHPHKYVNRDFSYTESDDEPITDSICEFGMSMQYCDGYIYPSDGDVLYSVDLDGNSREEHGKGIGYSPYYPRLASESVTAGKAQISGWADLEVKITSPALRRCAHDGSSDMLIYDFASNKDGVWYQPHEWTTVENHIYLSYTRYCDANCDGVITDCETGYSLQSKGNKSCTVLRIDVTREKFTNGRR